MRRPLWVPACALISLALVTCMQSDPVAQGEDGGPIFVERVTAVVKLQQGLDASLPVQTSAVESDRRVEHQNALAKSLIAARRDARQGDVFTPMVAARLRAILRDAFAGPDGDNIRRTLQEGDPVTLRPLHVNDVYPENAPFATMPPTLLRRLPALPMELAYRIVGRELLLKDVDTNVIVDVLPDAVPARR